MPDPETYIRSRGYGISVIPAGGHYVAIAVPDHVGLPLRRAAGETRGDAMLRLAREVGMPEEADEPNGCGALPASE